MSNNLEIEVDTNSPSKSSSKSPKSKKIKKSISEFKNVGHWTKEEHQIYLQFLSDNANNLKTNKIFKPMSELIGTRSPSQCRSHHQKFNPYNKSVQPIQNQATSSSWDNNFEQDSPYQHQVQLRYFDDEEENPFPQQECFNFDDFE